MRLKPTIWWEITSVEDKEVFKDIANFLIEEIGKRAEKIKSDYQNETNQPKYQEDLTEDEQGYTYRQHVDEYFVGRFCELEEFKQILFRSLVLSIFSSLEGRLRGLCDRASAELQLVFFVKDLKGNGMGACIEYLDRVFDNNFLGDDKSIKKCCELRNILAHGNQKVPKEKQDICLEWAKINGFDLFFDNDEIFLKEEDLFRFIDFSYRVLFKAYECAVGEAPKF